MKRIDIDAEAEKILAQIFDLALKNNGFQAYPFVQFLLSKVYEVPPVPKEG